jgi:hypothetical protein
VSFDLFLECFHNGKSSGIAEDDIRAAFGPALRDDPEFECWLVGYTAERSDCVMVYYSRDPEDETRVTGLLINRPLADPRLWQSLYQIMLLGNVALLFPGQEHPLVASASVIEHLPKKMQRATLVENAEAIIRAIEST